MNALRHVMILASAGSGKTYALTNRFVELLAHGAEPERIVALTFTRKAAGEFFDEILHKLARAAEDEGAAARLAADVHRPDLRAADFLRLLRRMVDAMHRLRLGTLDSFFTRIARSFPLELGLAGEFELLQEHAARVERQRVLRRMFARHGTGLDAAQAEFVEAFKRATFGVEEKRLGLQLDTFLDAHQETYLAAPQAELWGDQARIWGGTARWFREEIQLAAAVRDLRASLPPLSDGQRLRWDAFFTALEEWTPGGMLPDPVEYVVARAFAVWDDLETGAAEMTVERRKLRLPAVAGRALTRVVTHIVAAELRKQLEVTRGIHAVLRSYELQYHDAVRRAGRLTFADIQRLLQPETGAPTLTATRRARADAGAGEPLGATEGDPQLSLALDAAAAEEQAAVAERRLMLDYRLDAEIDHWLLDEFQDTSFGQWSVLRNLIDEVVQDPEARRSFFCVGDVKQAIYAWREGDPRLFREIYQHYNQAAPGAIEERHLVQSWRSGPPLIEMVNTVFGSAVTFSELFPGEASDAWNREWRAHVSAVPDRTGQAALLHGVDDAERWAVTRRLIEEIRPLERGLTCAVLVKKNATGAALADELRRAGISALAEADLHVATDNPFGAALLALAQAAAHPGDTLAWEHVRMTPLSAVLAAEGIATTADLAVPVLGRIHAEGFERGLQPWMARLEMQLAPDDAFSRQRAREFAAAAGLFDATGSRDIDEFIAFMERHTVRPPESAAAVRVMTIHKSKGLGFDVVILPDLEGQRLDIPREGLARQKAEDRSVSWVLDLPKKLFCEQDEVLSAYLRGAQAEACYENFSLLYVALTRAKRAMYVVTKPVEGSKSLNFPRLLATTLGEAPIEVAVGRQTFAGAWTAGDPGWFEPVVRPEPPSARERTLPTLPRGAAERSVRRVGRRPSDNRGARVSAAELFSLAGARGREFGDDLHACLAQVEWAQPADAAGWEARWRTEGHAAAVIERAAACLRAPGLASVWRRRAGAEVWRERSFEAVLGEAWVTGAFDRVIVERDADGRIGAATLYDFKTDRVPKEGGAALVRRYAEQLGVYRRVVAQLTGLAPEQVGAYLVLVANAEPVEVPAGA